MARNAAKALGLIFLLLVLVLGAFVAGMLMFRPGNDSGAALLLEQKNKELDEKDTQIQGLETQLAQLRDELDESARQIAELQKRVQETGRALPSDQQGIRDATREPEHQPPARVEPVEKPPPRAPEPSTAEVWRRPAETGTYEVLRTTFVFAEPLGNSRTVAIIQKGTKVTVVRSAGDWLEVRSKRGNPPGFIRRDDAMFIEGGN